MSRFFAVLWVTGFLIASPLEARAQVGFIVIPGISIGPAEVRIDGEVAGTLNAAELTLTVPAGVRQLAVLLEGYSTFTKEVSVGAEEVVIVDVELLPADVRIVEDSPQGGELQQAIRELRFLSLEPARLAFSVNDEARGETPATVLVPVGEVRIAVEGREWCLFLPPGTEAAYFRIRAGEMDRIQGASICHNRAEVGRGVATPAGRPPPIRFSGEFEVWGEALPPSDGITPPDVLYEDPSGDWSLTVRSGEPSGSLPCYTVLFCVNENIACLGFNTTASDGTPTLDRIRIEDGFHNGKSMGLIGGELRNINITARVLDSDLWRRRAVFLVGHEVETGIRRLRVRLWVTEDLGPVG